MLAVPYASRCAFPDMEPVNFRSQLTRECDNDLAMGGTSSINRFLALYFTSVSHIINSIPHYLLHQGSAFNN